MVEPKSEKNQEQTSDKATSSLHHLPEFWVLNITHRCPTCGDTQDKLHLKLTADGWLTVDTSRAW